MDKIDKDKINKDKIDKIEKEKLDYRVIGVRRVSRTVQGGRKMRLSVIVVVGNKNGGFGHVMVKSSDALSAIKKAYRLALRRMKNIYINKKNFSIESPVNGVFKSTKILLRPAKTGTGIIAGGAAARSVFELAGIQNIVSKIHGSTTPQNVLKAIDDAVQKLRVRHLIKEIRKNEIASVKTN